MAKQELIKIDIKSGYEQWWRYNVYVSAASFRNGERITYRSLTDIVYPLEGGDEVRLCPANYNPQRPIHLEVEAGDSLELFAYVIPNTMPADDAIRQSPPFKMKLKVKGAYINHSEEFSVNQWGGVSVHLSFDESNK